MKQSLSHDNSYVFGKKSSQNRGFLRIGKFYALDGSYGANVSLDVTYPHIISILGKRGYGKSYTMGVFIEELANLDDRTKEDLCIIIIDTLGIYWTMKYPNRKETAMLQQWNLTPESIDVHIYTPHITNLHNNNNQTDRNSFYIPEYLLSPEIWCQIFNIEPTSSFGIALIQTVYNLKEKKKTFHLEDIFQSIQTNPTVSQEIKDIATNYYQYAKSIGIFSDRTNDITEIFQKGAINIIDISNLNGIHIKQMIIGIICELIFQYRIDARMKEEKELIGRQKRKIRNPKVWMAIDEAQIFLPRTMEQFSKTILIEHWLRQGRQPGLSLILATQQPSALDLEVFSHSDLIFCHRLTSQKDIKTLHDIRPSYMQDDISSVMQMMGHEKGVCNVIDDTMEQIHICKIRPRKSWHGGDEPKIGYCHE